MLGIIRLYSWPKTGYPLLEMHDFHLSANLVFVGNLGRLADLLEIFAMIGFAGFALLYSMAEYTEANREKSRLADLGSGALIPPAF